MRLQRHTSCLSPCEIIQIKRTEQPDSVWMAARQPGWLVTPLAVLCPRTVQTCVVQEITDILQRATTEPTLCGRTSAAVLIRAQVAHSQHIRVRLQPLHNKLLGASRLGSDQGTGTSSQSQIQEVLHSQGPIFKSFNPANKCYKKASTFVAVLQPCYV